MRKTDRKLKAFPPIAFLIAFIVLGLLTTGQMLILGAFVDYQNIPNNYIIAVIIYWLIGAAAFTLLISFQIGRYFERPMMRFAKATQRVAGGDFSVYVKPLHRADKLNYMDHMFIDFNRMVEQLGSIETLKTDFFSNVSHEIKTPISVIQNYAEMLCKEGLSESERIEYADTVCVASRRLSELITNLLKLSKLEKQTILPSSAPYDVSRQLCDVILTFESQWEQKNIDLLIDIEDSAYIAADESLMMLVWSNLLSNALKFTQEGGSISVKQYSSQSEVIVVMSDTGCGMDEATLRHIFEKFYQGDASHSTPGNGLGLALVQRILNLMDCNIIVHSTPNVGSEFIVKMPAWQGLIDDNAMQGGHYES